MHGRRGRNPPQRTSVFQIFDRRRETLRFGFHHRLKGGYPPQAKEPARGAPAFQRFNRGFFSTSATAPAHHAQCPPNSPRRSMAPSTPSSRNRAVARTISTGSKVAGSFQ